MSTSSQANRGQSLILVGFMGSGKSTIGRQLARRLGYAFLDLDQLLAASEGRSITDIFAADGEAYFRDRESELLDRQPRDQRVVLATGGGVVGRSANRIRLKELGTVIYLRAEWETLQRRLEQGSGRPLADPQHGWDAVRQLWRSRLPWYEEADIIIDTDRLPVPALVSELVRRLGLKEAHACDS